MTGRGKKKSEASQSEKSRWNHQAETEQTETKELMVHRSEQSAARCMRRSAGSEVILFILRYLISCSNQPPFLGSMRMIPAQVQQKLRKARQFLLASNFAQALPRYQKLSQLCSADAVIWFEYGSAAAGLRNRELADRAWQKAIKPIRTIGNPFWIFFDQFFKFFV
ncbi:MAG: hypothetical protein DME22_21640 [Verrucomicrobia bacterium]|nr:MAG: hypothetical protein DME22_21640 [Verrucomicrobiota bacterium]PYJ95741.1 MAG: hypothetical protein DME23_22975 [Verrucomicrobiota bacterium]